MFWLFALGIVALCVYSKGFRKFCAITAAALTVVYIGCLIFWSIDNARLEKEKTAQLAARDAAQVAEAKLPICTGELLDMAYGKPGVCRAEPGPN